MLALMQMRANYIYTYLITKLQLLMGKTHHHLIKLSYK